MSLARVCLSWNKVTDHDFLDSGGNGWEWMGLDGNGWDWMGMDGVSGGLCLLVGLRGECWDV